MTEDQSTNIDFLAPPHRGLKIAIIAMGLLLLFGFASLFILLAKRGYDAAETVAEPSPPTPSVSEAPETVEPLSWWRGARFISKLEVPDDADVLHMTMAGDRIALLVNTQEGREIILYDLLSLREIGVIRLVDTPMDEDDQLLMPGAPPEPLAQPINPPG